VYYFYLLNVIYITFYLLWNEQELFLVAMLTYTELTFFTQNKSINNQFDSRCIAVGGV